MSCSTLTQQQTRFVVSAGALPEGFCPANLQEFFEAMVSRMIIGTNQQFSSFVIGPNEPTSNQGPWLKNCEQWFFWDDATGRYIPQQKTGFNNEQFFMATGSFVVPDFIYKLKVSLWGAGGGGGNLGGSESGGGGGGAFCQGILDVTPGQIIAVTVGTGGAAGTPGGTGGTTTVLTLSAGGGTGGNGLPTPPNAGLGGTATGGTLNFPGQGGGAALGTDPGNGGSAPQGGFGGQFDYGGNRAANINGTYPGGGGVGSASTGSLTAGNGANGGALLEW